MKFCLWMTALASLALGQQIPVTGVAGARFRVADLAKAREFYSKVIGFSQKTGAAAGLAVFSINGGQFLEFEKGDAKDPLATVYLGVGGHAPAPLQDPEGHRVEFVETSGRPAVKIVSEHLLHIGMGVADLGRAVDFYAGHFAGREIFRRPDNQIVILRLPGPREDWLEFIVRQEQGSQDHICLDVPDIQQAYRTLIERGATLRAKPRVASNGYWVINMTDTNGLRVELMEPQPAKK